MYRYWCSALVTRIILVKQMNRYSSFVSKSPPCSNLFPPCSKSLFNHMKRANYVAKVWKRAHEFDPTGGESPLDYGWSEGNDGTCRPNWFSGKPIPAYLTGEISDDSEQGPRQCEEEEIWNE